MAWIVKGGWTPVSAASQNGHLEVVKFLVLEKNVDANKWDEVWSRAAWAWDLFF